MKRHCTWMLSVTVLILMLPAARRQGDGVPRAVVAAHPLTQAEAPLVVQRDRKQCLGDSFRWWVTFNGEPLPRKDVVPLGDLAICVPRPAPGEYQFRLRAHAESGARHTARATVVVVAGHAATADTRGEETVVTPNPPTARRLEEELVNVPAPSDELRQRLKLDPFYHKHVDAGGFPVLGSPKVSDAALREAAYLINNVLARREDIRRELIQRKVRFVVMATTELTTDVPEHRHFRPAKYWDKRARGLGARPGASLVASCGEENLLQAPGDPYPRQNILLHEFAHTIHFMALNFMDSEFEPRLERTYQQAVAQGLWKDRYAGGSHIEYWAEGVQSWFDANNVPGARTRQQLEQYDPRLAKLVSEVFGGVPWRYQRPRRRAGQLHLREWDVTRLPAFSWPPELVQWYRAYKANKK